MAKLGGFVGALTGVVIAVFFTEVVFPNDQEWPIIFLGVGAALGWLIGSSIVRHLQQRRARPL
jgi:uncharacterized membrane protein YfcA